MFCDSDGENKNPGLVAYFTLDVGRDLESADRFSITRWTKKNDVWDIPVQDIADDAAVVLYWSPRELQPGQRRRVGFAYGLGVVPRAKDGHGSKERKD